jgi:putative transposase
MQAKYLVAIMDLFSRYIVGWSLSNTMEAEWVVSVLKETVNKHGTPGIINSDQGTQFTSNVYINYVKNLETVKISMDGKGRATDNAYIERFYRTIKYEKIYLEHPETVRALHYVCSRFIQYYNERRDHSSVGAIPPLRAYRRAA